jgi:Trypsin-like peptidase domain
MAALTSDHVTSLVSQLQACTALVQTEDGTSNGAGFFVDSHLLLTCAHVVGLGDKVSVTPYMRPARPGRVDEIRSVADGDIALVIVEPHPEDPGAFPAVLLDLAADEGTYHAAGFPADEWSPQGLETIAYDGNVRTSQETGNLLAVKLSGKQVNFGMSGGPVLNDRSGAVVAMTRYSKDTGSDLGGGAIPISFVAQAFPQIEERIHEPPLATHGWRDCVPMSVWADLERVWPSYAPTFDVRVSGDLSKWLVGLETANEPLEALTVRDLGEEVAEVLFQWAATRRLRGKDEVRLLGKLLAGALLPKGLAERLVKAQSNPELHVRLRVEPRTEGLVDVPWELAASPGTADGLGAATGFRFSRVASELITTKASWAPRTERVPVLALVIQPPGHAYPAVFYDGQALEWPAIADVVSRLKQALPPPLSASLQQNLTPGAIDAMLRQGDGFPVDVIHYIGPARLKDRKPEIGVLDDDRLGWEPIATLGQWIRQSGARVAVIEFAIPPVGLESDVITPSQVLRALQSGVQAVIVTRVPVHPRQFAPFNDRFYAGIAAGDTVEAAVQFARRELQSNHPLGDYAGFGWFGLFTGSRVGLRLYSGEQGTGRSSRRSRDPDSDSGTSRAESEDTDAFG